MEPVNSHHDYGTHRWTAQLHFSVRPSTVTLTSSTHVRSGGSLECVGNRNHRAEPLPVLRRAPTLSDEKQPTPCWPKSPLSFRAHTEVRAGKTPGKLRFRRSTALPAVPGKARPQGSILYPHGQTMGISFPLTFARSGTHGGGRIEIQEGEVADRIRFRRETRKEWDSRDNSNGESGSQ